MTAKLTWLLNINADEELESPASYKGVRDKSVEDRARYARIAGHLHDLTGNDEVISPFQAPSEPTNHIKGSDRCGAAWMMTPYASRVLSAHGVAPIEAPTLPILAKVNARAFSSRLGVDLPGATYVETAEEALRILSTPGETGEWLLSRPYGYVGRGKRRVRAGLLSSEDVSWVRSSITRHGGLEVTPWVNRTGDYGLHGFLRRDGSCIVGELTTQNCDKSGQWVSTERASGVDVGITNGITCAFRETADALQREGYFGPFGIDAFTWRDASGRSRLVPRCEINARFSMGWAIGMAGHRLHTLLLP